ncbi:MAG: UDP-2,3-diacylglucosamine diphosphatase [Alphaproteobacteria bacterium]|nr:UDP-2,3-diacylglucosamine diphosphatase [Alphaproteobacteria bacterium]
MSLKLDLQMHTGPDGFPVLHFPMMVISDIHLGTNQGNVEDTSLVLERTTCDRLFLAGDIIDGWALQHKKQSALSEMEKNVLAHFIRKAGQNTDVTYMPGNHDAAFRGHNILQNRQKLSHRKLTGKFLCNIRIEEKAEYADPKGRRFLILHGDQYDGSAPQHIHNLGKSVGAVHKKIKNIAQKLTPHFNKKTAGIPSLSLSLRNHFSCKAKIGQGVKAIVDWYTNIRRYVIQELENLPHDGIIYGHSHKSGFRRTFMGRMLANDGSCLIYPQTLVGDRRGNLGVITWHRDRIDVEMEQGHRYTLMPEQLGQDFAIAYKSAAKIYDDVATQKADHISRLICLSFPDGSA